MMVNKINLTKGRYNIRTTVLNCILLIAISGCSTVVETQTGTEAKTPKKTETEYDNVSKAIGHLISYETKRKIDLSYGINSPLKEVMKTYHSDIVHLPKEEQVMFFFMVDTNINVHGGESLFVFYNFIYLACGEEYIRLLKQSTNNPYFKPDMINIRLKSMEEREPQLKFQAKKKGISFNDYLKELKLEYGFQ